MSSILNSISSGDLQVQQVPGEIPVKEDSIIDLLQNSEIEFKTCQQAPNKLDDMNTGFGEGQELHYDTPCKKPTLKTPLYKDNYLQEFVTEEDKAAARRALGLHTKGDIVTEGLITLTDDLPSRQDLIRAAICQLKKENNFVAPITLTKAVLTDEGDSLHSIIQNMKSTIKDNADILNSIVKESNSKNITSLGDVKKFLHGFNNGDNLKNTLATMNEEMVRFDVINN